jgi:hypothetical protein
MRGERRYANGIAWLMPGAALAGYRQLLNAGAGQ